MHADTEDIYVSKIIFIACEEEGQTSTLKSAARVQTSSLAHFSLLLTSEDSVITSVPNLTVK